ncbi:hypothetical protein [Streptomyces sp. WM6368]|uniref:hypothetical protein n=1 Tax=Streptomyces sp. WM6368 TaxID=1415554 RepID=UPI0006AFA632|nr:hypothetical protein [Streptomyces sp. WM6368]KOU20226.1 hypothetical protein ADK51_24805 [Streptomyces sp. WM6368]
MLNDFWKGLGGKLSERWLAALFSPACLFWLAGAAAWLRGVGWPTVQRLGWAGAAEQWTAGLTGLPVLVQGAAVVGLLLLLTLSGLLLQFFSQPLVRGLEGYWVLLPGPRRRLRERLGRRADADIAALRPLAARPADSLDADALAERGRLARRVRSVPFDPRRRMPTRFGNVLRASEDRVRAHYGLDPVVCWPRLWLLLPDAARTEVLASRRSVHLTAHLWACAVLCCVWSVWTLWAVPLSLAVAATAYRGFLLSAARLHADVVESCFDLYRQQLYGSLRHPLPENPLAEYRAGRRLTTYLSAGSRRPEPLFTDPSSSGAPSGGPPPC